MVHTIMNFSLRVSIIADHDMQVINTASITHEIDNAVKNALKKDEDKDCMVNCFSALIQFTNAGELV